MKDSIKAGTLTRTAAILLIGNELLSGKIRDENAYFLTQRLRELGVTVERVLIIPDRVNLIGEEVRSLSDRYDFVFTSGGVGPTHDDVTLEGIAYGFEEELYLDTRLQALLSKYFGAQLNDAHLRMAHIPHGSTLIWPHGEAWPVYSYQNVFIFAGIPAVLKAKFNSIAERFRTGTFYLRSIYLNLREGVIAETLRALEANFQVAVGSYPRVTPDVNYLVRVTIEAREAERVNQAVTHFISTLNHMRDERVLEHSLSEDQSMIAHLDPPLPSAE